MMRAVAVLVVSALTANCATATASRARPSLAGDYVAATSAAQDQPGVTAAFVKGIPLGARIAVTLTDGDRLKGTLMVVQEDAIVVRPRTRLPEPAQTIPFARIATIETEREGGMGKAIAIGAAVGAGAALGVFLAILVALSD